MTKIEEARAKYMNEKLRLTTMCINRASATEVSKQRELVEQLYRDWMKMEVKK